MRLLAIDPGQTTGFAVFEHQPRFPFFKALLLEWWESAGVPLDVFAPQFLSVLRTTQPTHVVIEDYRIFAGKAGMHIGQPLHTAELIGAIVALCSTVVPPISTSRVAPSKKGRWPPARLEAKFPDAVGITGAHASDAVKIGLVYLEAQGEGRWPE